MSFMISRCVRSTARAFTETRTRARGLAVIFTRALVFCKRANFANEHVRHVRAAHDADEDHAERICAALNIQ